MGLDVMSDMNDMMNLFNQIKQNPMQILSRKFNIPQGINVQNPNDIIQYLLNTGQVSQSQVNQIMGMQNNPMLRKLLGR